MRRILRIGLAFPLMLAIGCDGGSSAPADPSKAVVAPPPPGKPPLKDGKRAASTPHL